MILNRFIEEMRPSIEGNMKNTINKLITEETTGMFEMLKYHLGWDKENGGNIISGKRVRPLLVLLSTLAVGGKWESALPAASAVELVHNFSLIHDDIQDNSDLRRGKKTVWKEWGSAQAINAGDAMFALAHMALTDLENTASPSISLQAHKILPKACLILTQGQFLDISYEKRNDITIDDYWPMISGKTASLISTSTELGALIGGADAEMQKIFKEFGNLIGLAFQVYDDFLGIWGMPSITGKSIASDLISGKKSLPVLYGLKNSSTFSKRWNEGPIFENEVKEVSELLSTAGAKKYTNDKAEELTTKAISKFNESGISSSSGDALLKLSKNLILREN